MDEDDDPDDVKTDNSHRTIRLDDRTIERLAAWRRTQDGLRARHADRWIDDDLVLTTRYGTPINRNNMLRSVRRLCEAAEIVPSIVTYELRHTAISFQADAGKSSWEIADWAGTSERMIAASTSLTSWTSPQPIARQAERSRRVAAAPFRPRRPT